MARQRRDGSPAPRRAGALADSPTRLARKLRAALQPDLVRLLWGIASNREEDIRDRLTAARSLLDEPTPDLDDLVNRVEELEAELEAAARLEEESSASPEPPRPPGADA